MADLATSLTATEDDLLDAAEQAVRDYCGWHIAPVVEDDTYTFTARSDGRLYLPTMLLTGVASVSVVGYEDDPYDLDTLLWDERGWIEPLTGYCWPHTWRDARGLTVTFSHGYAAPPPAVRGVVQAVAQRGVSNPAGLKRDQSGPFVEEYHPGHLNMADMAALAPYVIHRV